MILREAFKGGSTDDVLNRRKLGFPVPIAHWLKTDLYEWAKQLIDTSETDARNKKRRLWQKNLDIVAFMLCHQVHYKNKSSYSLIYVQTNRLFIAH